MTMNDSFDGRLSAWLRDTSDHRVPDHLDEVLVVTAATRQRTWWSSPERWLPVTATSLAGRFAPLRPMLILTLVGLLVVAAVGLIAYVGSNRPPTPFHSGLAGNGQILGVDTSGTLMSYSADGGGGVPLGTIAGDTPSLSISPDGTRVAYKLMGSHYGVAIRQLSDQSVVEILAPVPDLQSEPLSWSPDGRFIAFAGYPFGGDRLFVAATDGSSVVDRTPSTLSKNMVLGRPTFSPDGTLIAFTAHQGSQADDAVLYVMRPDGTELRSLPTGRVSAGNAGEPDWAPDPAVRRIAFETLIVDTLAVRLFDLDLGVDHAAGAGFWLSWSPDGSRIATCCAQVTTTSSILAGNLDTKTVFDQGGRDGSCNEYTGAAGKSICSRAVWSPDGKELIATDIVGGSLLVTPVDGTGLATRNFPLQGLDLDHPAGPYAWQPIWP